MRILMLSSRIPYPLTAGFRQVIYGIAKQCRLHGHEVDLLYLGSDEEYDRYRKPLGEVFTNVYHIPIRRSEAIRNVIKNVFSPGVPFQVALYQSRALYNKLMEIEGGYDRVIGFHIRMAEYLYTLDPQKTILQMVDAISLNYRDAIKVAGGIKKLVYKTEYPRVLRYERDAMERSRKVVMVSKKDATWLEGEGADVSRVTVIPVAVRDDIAHRKADYRADEDAICFIGKMSYQPNADSIRWFIKNVMPKLSERYPSLTLYVMGIEPPEDIVRSGQESANIRVTGFVEDPYEIMARCKATIAPIQNGAGVQSKVLEGMMVGTPVVASPLAAMGIDAEDERDLLVAGQPDEWVNKLSRLIDDDNERTRIGRGGQSYVESGFTWDICWQKWSELL